MSFTDEQLLNLVNNTIKTKTEFEINDFTGGSIQITSTNNHQLIKYKVSLFFGYSNRNAISKTFSIKEEFVNIWQKAILLKVKSLQVSNNGMDYSELNALMNNLDEVEVVSNKVEVVSKGSTNNRKMNRTIEFSENEQQEEQSFSFSLTRETSYENLSLEYREKLKEEIEKLNLSLSFIDFVDSLVAKGYKYKNFLMAYKTWCKKDFNTSKKTTNNSFGGWSE